MTKPTKQQILDCTDINQLERWVAEVCEGLEWVGENQCFGYYADYFDIDGNRPFTEVEYQPCHDTDLGRSQCWQLMVRYRIKVEAYPDFSYATYEDGFNEVRDETPQIAVAKAALLSKIGDE